MHSIHGFDPTDLSSKTRVDAIAPAAMLIIVEPCVAIISVCLPTMGPALQDLASYSTIEYLKMICRIKTAVAPQRPPSVERAMVYTPSGWREEPTRVRDGVLDSLSLRDVESGSLENMPLEPAMARGRWMSV
ncbi:MAG: hypothetical protein Q9200_005357 [Gallowayella weberi]